MPKSLNILVVEDESLYADLLIDMLEDLGHTHLGPVSTGAEALALYQESSPDLVLLDIDLDGSMDGIEVAAAMQDLRPTPVIFVTANVDDSTYARAKATGPYGFLEKTARKRALQRSIELVVEKLPTEAKEVPTAPKPVDGLLLVRTNDKLHKIAIEDLLFIEASDHYCELHTASRKFTSRISLKNLLASLPEDEFFRTHRSWAVRLAAIESISPSDQSIQIGSHSIPLGRTYKDQLFARLKMI